MSMPLGGSVGARLGGGGGRRLAFCLIFVVCSLIFLKKP